MPIWKKEEREKILEKLDCHVGTLKNPCFVRIKEFATPLKEIFNTDTAGILGLSIVASIITAINALWKYKKGITLALYILYDA